jgi:hypothetical protein
MALATAFAFLVLLSSGASDVVPSGDEPSSTPLLPVPREHPNHTKGEVGKACSCWSWCHPQEVSDFFHRLPVVHSTGSPWVSYLRALYGREDVPLPLDLGSFGAFRLPPDNALVLGGGLGLPFSHRCDKATAMRARMPPCFEAGFEGTRRAGTERCEKWLNLTEARESTRPRMPDEKLSLQKSNYLELRWELPPAASSEPIQRSQRTQSPCSMEYLRTAS